MARVFHMFALLLYASFAFFQQNDPDGTTWTLIYGSGAVLSGFALVGHRYPMLALGFFWMYLGMAVLLVPEVLTFFSNDDGIGWAEGMANDYPYIEKSREFGGLLIASGLAIGNYLFLRRKAKVPKTE